MSRFTSNATCRPRALVTAFTALGVLAVAALVSPTPASAADDGFQTNVYFTAHDLSTEQGTRALYRRIVNAAEEVCPGMDSLSPAAVSMAKECERVAIARAIGQIGSARLAAVDAKEVARSG
jgi:UrcA family protein